MANKYKQNNYNEYHCPLCRMPFKYIGPFREHKLVCNATTKTFIKVGRLTIYTG
jgi:hypothetical protein